MSWFASFLTPFALVFSVALVVSASWWGTIPDHEEFRFSIISVGFHANALLSGMTPFWNPNLGLGIPHPLAQSFLFHPLLPLFAWLSPERAVQVFYFFHAVFGSVGFFLLVRSFQIRLPIASVATATFLLCSAACHYSMTDLWPIEYVGWTTLPFVILFLKKLFLVYSNRERLLQSSLLALSIAFLIRCSHPGQVPAFILAILVFCLVSAKPSFKRFYWLCGTLFVTVLLCMPTVYHLLSEVGRFSEQAVRTGESYRFSFSDFWHLLSRPFGGALFGIGNANSTRVLFWGPPFVLLTGVGIYRMVRRWPANAEITLPFLVSLLLMALPKETLG